MSVPIAADDLAAIAQQFDVTGHVREARPWGEGHINDTYRVELTGDHRDPGVDEPPIQYDFIILQRINHNVFKDPLRLMENVARVTAHLKRSLAAESETNSRLHADLGRRALQVIPTRSGATCHRDENGNTWRMYPFIARAHAGEVVETAAQVREAGLAFGSFLRRLADLPGPPLHETIPHFHDGRRRLEAFRRAVAADQAGRAGGLGREIGMILDRGAIFDVLPEAIQHGDLPLRTVHNDAKVSNVMLDDATGEGLCVIDLDTVMPGLAAYDFGDLMRTAANPAAEDERDLARVQVDLERFEALARGYVEGAGKILTSSERAHLVFGGKMMTLIMAVRFLTDYLEGDVYYKTRHPGHNVERCRAQLCLVESIEAREAELQGIITTIL